MEPYKILILDALPETTGQAVRAALDGDRYEVLGAGAFTESQLWTADCIITRETAVTAEMMRQAKRLRLIICYETGTAAINVDDADTHSVSVVEIPHLALHSVAEFTVMTILLLAKNMLRACHDTKERTWLPELQPHLTTQTDYAYNWISLTNFGALYGRTVGLVGLGTVGTAVAKLLRPFGVSILYTKRNRLDQMAERKLGVEYASLGGLLRRSDFVSLHVKLNPETEGLIGRRELAMMKPSSFLINTSRGRVVDEEALHDAMEDRRLAGAALDVFRKEPLPAESPLWDADNVLITPHIAGIPMTEATEAQAEMIIGAIKDYCGG